jgi:hypothetical protein
VVSIIRVFCLFLNNSEIDAQSLGNGVLMHFLSHVLHLLNLVSDLLVEVSQSFLSLVLDLLRGLHPGVEGLENLEE